ncbi:MAG: hypothetical protein NTV34_01970, partial [Proteobacteria bacterium]|nr:hypothetical protein [Pseudomonadota bacterium]
MKLKNQQYLPIKTKAQTQSESAMQEIRNKFQTQADDLHGHGFRSSELGDSHLELPMLPTPQRGRSRTNKIALSKRLLKSAQMNLPDPKDQLISLGLIER